MTETIEQELARLKAENAALKAGQEVALRFKISDKGCISVYGLGKWPVSLYRSQWAILLANAPGIQQFIDLHKARLDAHEAERSIPRRADEPGATDAMLKDF